VLLRRDLFIFKKDTKRNQNILTGTKTGYIIRAEYKKGGNNEEKTTTAAMENSRSANPSKVDTRAS